ncbi:hypothetical protein ABPG74_004863 [Tetrahymena malaccensis]
MNIFEPKDNYYYREFSSYEIEQQCYELLLRQLEVCLNLYKPHFELEYKYFGGTHDNQEFEFEEKRYYLNLIVFDKQQNVKKKLVAFENNYKNEKLIKYYIDLLKYFPRKDLLYCLYDSYYLDSKKTFYIFELECPKTANFSNFMDYFDIVEETVEKIKTAFCDQLIEFDKTQLVKQFRSKDKNKFNLLDQDYMLKIFSNKKQVSYKSHEIKKQMYVKQLNQMPLSFCFASFENFQKQQKSQKQNQYDSDDSNGSDIDENDNMQQEDNLHEQEQPEESEKDSIYSSLFNEDSIFNQNEAINNLIRNEEEQISEKNASSDSNTNQIVKQIDEHPSSLKSLQSLEQTQNIEQEFNQQDNHLESNQKQNLITELNSQETNFEKDKNKEQQTSKTGEENQKDTKVEIEELNENNSQSKLEDQVPEQDKEDSNSEEQQEPEEGKEDADDEEEESIDSKKEDENSMISSYWNADEDLVNQLLDFNERIFIKIKKENLIDMIKEFYSDILNYHQEEIFIVIQQHPKYDDFEVLSYDSDQFKLKCNKENDQRILLVKKFSCFQKIQEEEKLINQQSNIINNLIVTEIVLQEKHSYLLVEYKYFQPSKQIYFYPTIEDLLQNLANDRQSKLFIIELLIQISYELFNKYNIKITNICPSKIFIQGKIDAAEQNKKFSIIIQEVGIEKFEQKYLDLIKPQQNYYGYKEQYQKNCTTNLETLLNQFFNDLQIKSKQEISNLYEEITQHIYLLKYTRDSNRELLITKNNKFYKQFGSYRNIEQSKDQQLVASLEISFEEFFNWQIDVKQESTDLYNSLFKNKQYQWSLPFEQQEQFEKHYLKFSNYIKFEKNKQVEDNNKLENEMELEIPSQNQLQENEEDNAQEDEVILTELKNMLTICFEHNLKKKTNFKIEIIKSNTIKFRNYYMYYDFDYFKIASEFMKDNSNILQIDIKKYNSQATFSFAYVLGKILILEIQNQSEFYYQELANEDFSFQNIQILFKKMMFNFQDDHYRHQYIKLNFRMLQKFNNLQQLILDLTEQDVGKFLKDNQQIQLFQQQQKLLILNLYFNNQTQGLSHLIKQINLNKNINTIVFKKKDYYEEITFQQKQFRKQIFKLKRLVVFDRQKFDEQLQN